MQAGPEMTWVIAEHVANGAGEVSVSKGQQVEVLEVWSSRPDWWIVRIHGEPPVEGAVPVQVLKLQPQQAQQKTSPSRRPLSQACDDIGTYLTPTVHFACHSTPACHANSKYLTLVCLNIQIEKCENQIVRCRFDLINPIKHFILSKKVKIFL